MIYFALARTVDDPAVAAQIVGLGLDAMRFSARRTKVLFPQGLGAGFGAQFGVVAAQLADDLREGDLASAQRGLAAIVDGDGFDDPGSQACAVLFRQSCLEFAALAGSQSPDLVGKLRAAFAQTLDAAVLTLTVAQSDDAWASVAESMALSKEIDIVHKAYLTYGGLDAEFLGYVAALESSGRPDVDSYAVQVTANYHEEAAEMRQGRDLLDALDFTHHMAAIATYAALLHGDAHAPDEKPRLAAAEVATSCGSSLLADVFGDEGSRYPLLIDPDYAADLRAAARSTLEGAGSWADVLPDDVLLQAIGRAVDVRAGQPSIVLP